MPVAIEDRLILLSAAAERLGLTIPTLHLLCRQGKVPAVKLPSTGGKRVTWRMRESDVARIIAEGLPIEGRDG